MALVGTDDGDPIRPWPRVCDADRVRVFRATLPSGDGLGLARGEALSTIVGDGAIDDGAAVDAFPGVENEEEIREPLQHHQTFALRTFHRTLPGGDVYSWWRNQARAAPNCHSARIQ